LPDPIPEIVQRMIQRNPIAIRRLVRLIEFVDDEAMLRLRLEALDLGVIRRAAVTGHAVRQ